MYFSLANVKIRLILKFYCLNVVINVILLLYANNGCEQRLNYSYTYSYRAPLKTAFDNF